MRKATKQKPIEFHINRRGCKGKMSKAAMVALANAAVDLYRAEMLRQRALRAGGLAVVRKYGKKHMAKIGSKGGIAASQKRQAKWAARRHRANARMAKHWGKV